MAEGGLPLRSPKVIRAIMARVSDMIPRIADLKRLEDEGW